MALNIRQLQAFLTIVQTGSLGRAAHALHITQPALSRSVRQLEQKVGVALFERHSTGMVLTPYGQAFLPHARLLNEESDLAVEEIDAMRGLGKGTARIGAVASVVSGALPRAIERLLLRWPGLRVQILEGVDDALASAPVKHDIDLAVGISLEETEEISLVAESGWEDLGGIVASTKHLLWRKDSLSLPDLQHELWALPPRGTRPRDELHQLFANEGMEPPLVAVETRSVTAIKALVLSANFLGSLPLPLYEAEREAGTMGALPISGTQLGRHFFVFRRRRGSLPRPAAQLLEELRHITGKAGAARRPSL